MAHHVLRTFFTTTSDGDFQGAALLDAALSNEEACQQKGDLHICQHVQEFRRSVFVERCSFSSLHRCLRQVDEVDGRVFFVAELRVRDLWEAVAEQIELGLPEREFSSEPLDNEGSAPKSGCRSHVDEDLKRRLTSEIFEEGSGQSGQPTVKRIDGKRLREWQHKDMASHLWHRIVLSSVAQVPACAPTMLLDWANQRRRLRCSRSQATSRTSRRSCRIRRAHCNTLPLHAILCRCNAITCHCMQTLSVLLGF